MQKVFLCFLLFSLCLPCWADATPATKAEKFLTQPKKLVAKKVIEQEKFYLAHRSYSLTGEALALYVPGEKGLVRALQLDLHELLFNQKVGKSVYVDYEELQRLSQTIDHVLKVKAEWDKRENASPIQFVFTTKDGLAIKLKPGQEHLLITLWSDKWFGEGEKQQTEKENGLAINEKELNNLKKIVDQQFAVLQKVKGKNLY